MSLLDKLLKSKEPRTSRRGGTLARIAAGRAVARDRKRRVTVHVTPRARRAARAEEATVAQLRDDIGFLLREITRLEKQLEKVSEQRDHLLKAGY